MLSRRFFERLGSAGDGVASYLNSPAVTEGALTVEQKSIPRRQPPVDSRNRRYFHRRRCPHFYLVRVDG